MARKKISIVVLNYNGKKDTLECLNSLSKLVKNKVEISVIVVDNASIDNSTLSIKKQFPKFELIENKTNLGFSEGNNLGIERAIKRNSDFILILNNDTIVDSQLLNQLLASAKQYNADVISPKIYFAKGYEFHKDRYKKDDLGKVIWYAGGKIDWKNILTSHRGVDEVDQGQFDQAQRTDYATGCAMFVNKKVFERVGFFDPLFFAYFEDADFSLRSKKAGFKLLYAPTAKLWHKNAASFRGSGSKFQDFFITRNRILFGLRYAPIRAKLALAKEMLRVYSKGSEIKKSAIKSALNKEKIDEQIVHNLLKS